MILCDYLGYVKVFYVKVFYIEEQLDPLQKRSPVPLSWNLCLQRGSDLLFPTP